MKVLLKPGDALRIEFDDGDGGFDVSWSADGARIIVRADLPDGEGREGVIYDEDGALPDRPIDAREFDPDGVIARRGREVAERLAIEGDAPDEPVDGPVVVFGSRTTTRETTIEEAKRILREGLAPFLNTPMTADVIRAVRRGATEHVAKIREQFRLERPPGRVEAVSEPGGKLRVSFEAKAFAGLPAGALRRMGFDVPEFVPDDAVSRLVVEEGEERIAFEGVDFVVLSFVLRDDGTSGVEVAP